MRLCGLVATEIAGLGREIARERRFVHHEFSHLKNTS